MTKIEVISIISPFISAALTAYLTYRFTLNSKRIDILYENKIPAFKEVASKIGNFKNFCIGRVAYFDGNEFSPFYEEKIGALNHRTEIANSFFSNSIFLSRNSRFLITELLNNMSSLCSTEIAVVGGDKGLNPKNEYEKMFIMSESIIEILYQELNLVEG